MTVLRESAGEFDAESIRQQFPGLAATGIHYLDSAATSQNPQAVLDSHVWFETHARANVHGRVHRLSRAAIEAFEAARKSVARFLNAADEREIVFTYGATSAINLAAYSFGASLSEGDTVLLSILEHHSNLVPWQMLARRRGIKLRYLPMTVEGRLDLSRLEDFVSADCRLIALTHCSNVTGAITDLAPIVSAARSVGAKILIDGAQRIPHGPVDVHEMGIDFYAFSGHKMFGPTGIGVLWGRYDLLEEMPPFMVGGQMIERVTLEHAEFVEPPRRFEAGTPPIGGAIGLGAAVRWMEALDWSTVAAHERRLTRRMLDGLGSIKGVRIIGPADLHARRGVVSFVVDGVLPEDICAILDDRDVALRCGHHCAQPLHDAFGLRATARASLLAYNTDTDVDALLNGVEATAGKGT